MNDAFENLNSLDLWEALRGVDKAYTKPITGKSYKGDSPNPTWMIMKATEQLGPIGKDWGFTVQFDRTRLGAPHRIAVEEHVEMHPLPADATPETQPRAKCKTTKYEVIREEYHEVCIRFWFMNHDGKVGTFDAFGGTPMLYLTKNGRWMHDEDAAKKSLTDAYTKGLSWLGTAADIFLGIYDDKYQSVPTGGAEPPQQAQQPSGDQPDKEAADPPKSQNTGSRSTSTPEGW